MALELTNFSDFLNEVRKFIEGPLKNEGRWINDLDELFISRNENNNALFYILSDGTLVKVNLYIASPRAYNGNITLPKYHIYSCRTVKEMFSNQRRHRYKINIKTDGLFSMAFPINFQEQYNEMQKLEVCRYCLSKFLNKERVMDKDIQNFNLEEFHNNHISFFNFDTSILENGEDAVPIEYVEDWNQISKKLREQRNYTCQKCGFRARNTYEQRFIHTHHSNGDLANNTKENLKVLCIKCHSEVDIYHTQIKSSNNYREFMNLLEKGSK